MVDPEPARRQLGLRAAGRPRPDPRRRRPVPGDGRSSALDRKLREQIPRPPADDRQPEDRLGQSPHRRIQGCPTRQPALGQLARDGPHRQRFGGDRLLVPLERPAAVREAGAGQAGDHPRAQRRRHRQLGHGRSRIDTLAARRAGGLDLCREPLEDSDPHRSGRERGKCALSHLQRPMAADRARRSQDPCRWPRPAFVHHRRGRL